MSKSAGAAGMPGMKRSERAALVQRASEGLARIYVGQQGGERFWIKVKVRLGDMSLDVELDDKQRWRNKALSEWPINELPDILLAGLYCVRDLCQSYNDGEIESLPDQIKLPTGRARYKDMVILEVEKEKR